MSELREGQPEIRTPNLNVDLADMSQRWLGTTPPEPEEDLLPEFPEHFKPHGAVAQPAGPRPTIAAPEIPQPQPQAEFSAAWPPPAPETTPTPPVIAPEPSPPSEPAPAEPAAEATVSTSPELAAVTDPERQPEPSAVIEERVAEDPAVSPDAKEATGETLEKIDSFEALVNSKLERQNLNPEWVNKIALKLGDPRVREWGGLLLAGASILTNGLVFGQTIGLAMKGVTKAVEIATDPTVQQALGASRALRPLSQILGMWNAGAVTSRLIREKTLSREIPVMIDRTKEVMSKLEQPDLSGEERPGLQNELASLLGRQLACYRQGIDIERYYNARSEKDARPAPKSVIGRFGEWAKTPEGRKTILLIGTPLVLSALTPIGLPVAVAQAAFLGTTSFSAFERVQRLRAMSNEPGATSPDKPALYETTSAALKKYEESLGLTGSDEAAAEKLIALADKEVNTNRGKAALAALPGVVGTAAFYTLIGLPWDKIAHHLHADQALAFVRDKISSIGRAEHAKAATGTVAAAGAVRPGSYIPTTEYNRPVSTENGAYNFGDDLKNPEGYKGPHPDEIRTPTHTTPENFSGNASPTTRAPLPDHGDGSTRAFQGRPDSDGLPQTTHPEQAAATSEPGITGLNDFKAEPPEWAQGHEPGKIFEHNGQSYAFIDLNNNHHANKAELCRVIEDGGKRSVLLGWADIRGEDGIPEDLSRHNLAVKVDLDSSESDVIKTIDNKAGVLVAADHPNQYVTEISGGKPHFSSEPTQAQVFLFQHKADLVQGEVGAAKWEELKTKIGGEALKREDWQFTVGRHGAIASADNDLIPDMQIRWNHGDQTLGLDYHSTRFEFNPQEQPLTEAPGKLLEIAKGNPAIANSLEQTSLVFPPFKFGLEAIKLPNSSSASIESMLTDLTHYSSQYKEALSDVMNHAELKARLVETLHNSVHDNRIEAHDLNAALGLPDPDSDRVTPDFIRHNGDELTKADTLTYLEATKNHPDFRHSPWILPVSIAERAIKRAGDQLQEIWASERTGGTRIISLLLKNGSVKQYIMPKTLSLSWKTE